MADSGIGAAPWFERAEFVDRVARIQKQLKVRGHDALLAFQPESVTWLTGFFTRGYSTFQFALIPADGEPAVFCRDVARYYLERTCVFSDVDVWADGEDRLSLAANFLNKRLGSGARIAVELDAWQMTASRYLALRAALPATELVDADGLVSRERLLKSPAEVAYQRKAARAAEAGMQAAFDTDHRLPIARKAEA